MIWGFISFSGHLKIFKVEGTMTTTKYISMSEDFFFEELNKLGKKLNDIIFQQDNAPCHAFKMAKKWFLEQNIEVMELGLNKKVFF